MATKESSSKKQILKSSAIVGGASFITILIGLVKVKVLAVLLGPTGIGLMGILTTIMGTGATFFGMGLGTSGVRELALNNESTEKLGLVRKALFSANVILGLLATLTIFLFKERLSEWFFQSPDYQYAISIIAVGVFFSLISGSQTALLQGLRKITDLAKVKVIGAFTATFIGLLFIWILGESGVPFFVISVPLVTCLIAFYFCLKLPKTTSSSIAIKQLSIQWRSMFTLGFAFMLTGLMGTGSQLIVRSILNQKLNIESVGYFQAAWQISMTYITFVLGAMAADYYPRLTQSIHNKSEANRLVNEQTEIAIILAAPVLLAMLAFAPLVIKLLYSSEFTLSIEILQWQILGDVLKVISWPLGFIILAKGYSKIFFCTEILWNTSYVLLVYFGIDRFGIEVTGYVFYFSYLIYLVAVYFLVMNSNGFKWTKKNIKLIVMLIISSSMLLFISYFTLVGTMILGLLLFVYSAIYALNTLVELGIKNSKVDKIINIYKRCIQAIGFNF
ncbi:O-antigen translocase [Vibrio sp. 1288]|uniref:O-antigen translocase n=1 Tax=Vibrio sp. 1288 TaxID=3074550 RepID=UPI00296637A8|nr:O-antigen translocase [Vibrio sp. 1288]MDW3137686.1 O-antigen translocase [Vibrio sp. 1288]